MSRFCRLFAAVFLVLLAAAVRPALADPQYKLLKEIQVGGLGGWDYLHADPVGRRLYVAHATKIIVIDMDTDKVVGEIPDTPGVHGFFAVPELKRGFTSNGQGKNSSIIDLETLKLISKVPTGTNPDAILYEPASGEVYTFNGRSNDATAYDAKTGKVVVASIDLGGGKPETGVADPQAGKIYVNLENKSSIGVIDTKQHKLISTWPISGAEGPTGLVFDPKLHRLIIGCDKMVMMDSTNGKVVATLPCGKGVDACGIDLENHLAFVSAGGDGNVTVAKMEADKLTLVQTLTTERGARTMAVDAKTHKIYLANSKSITDPNSFKVLVYSLQ